MIDSKCDVCGRSPILGVASSSLGPISFAFCDECIQKNAEPACMLDATLDSVGLNVAPHVKACSTWVNGVYISWDEYVTSQGGWLLRLEGVMIERYEKPAFATEVATLRAERDEAQTDLGRVIMALPTGRGMRLAGAVEGVKMLRESEARMREALTGLEKAATEVSKYGAQTGPQWTRLTVANLRARAALQGEPK